MKHVSKIGWLVGLSFISLFIFFLSESRPMTREKKKVSYAELEEHVSAWVLNQIELLRCAIDEINDDDQMEREHRVMILDGIALQFMELLELISKVNHDSKHIIDWCQNFINKNKLADPEPLEM